MRKLNIDATKYDIRILWTGPKEEHVSADAGVVEGYPLDPPDELPGWFLVDVGVESLKDTDRYWTLWIRAKTKVRAKRKAKKPAPTEGTGVAAAGPVDAVLRAGGAAPAPAPRTPRIPTERKPRPAKKAPRRRKTAARPNQEPAPETAPEPAAEPSSAN